ALARVAQHDTKDVRPPPLSVGLQDRNARAEVDLSLFAGSTFQAPKRERPALAQATDITPNTVVLGGEAVLANQILVDGVRRQPCFELIEDDLSPGFTQAGLPMLVRLGSRRADGRPLGGGLF